MSVVTDLLPNVKQNLIMTHALDDTLLITYILAAIAYAESYQHVEKGTYSQAVMPTTTEQRHSLRHLMVLLKTYHKTTIQAYLVF